MDFEAALTARPLQPCGAFDMKRRGWVPPASQPAFVHTLDRHCLIALGVNQKLLPASIVNQVTKERAAEVAVEQGYPVGRRQMRELKERITEELRGRALTRRRVTHAWLDPGRGRLIVNSANAAQAEEVLDALREALETFAAQPLETARAPAASMSAWLMFGDAPGKFRIEEDLELRSNDDSKSSVRYTRHPLEGKEVQKHISSGKSPTRLGLSWSDRLSFVLNAEGQIKRVQFLDMTKDRAESPTDAAEQFDIEFALMTGEIGRMLDDLIEQLGGEADRLDQLHAA